MNYLLISSSIFGLISLVTGICVPLFGRKNYHKLWAIFNYLIGWWGLGQIMICLSGDNRESADFWWRAVTIPGMLIPPVFIHFAMRFCGYTGNRFILFAYAQAILFDVFSLTGHITYGLVYLYDSFYFVRIDNIPYAILAFSWIGVASYGNWVLYKALRTSSGEKKIRITYLLVGVIIGFVIGGSAHWLPAFGIPFHPAWNVFIGVFVLLATYALFRYDLIRIDHTVRKSLTYTLLISLMTAFYLISIALIERYFQKTVGYESLPITLIVLATMIVCAEPMRIRLQNFIDNIIFRSSLPNIMEERELLHKEMEKQDRMKAISALAAGMAHEIKNPLASLKTFAEYLPKKYDDPEFRETFASLIPAEVERINYTVTQLLDFSRPQEPVLKQEDIHQVLDETLSLLTNDLIKKRIEVIRRYEARNMTIKIDRNQMKQVFLNLFLNSIDSMSEGGKLTIVTETKSDGKIKIAIEDTGGGVPDDNLSRIFEPFYSTKEKGTGLGLSVVYRILEKHRGQIEAVNTERGLRISVVLKTYRT